MFLCPNCKVPLGRRQNSHGVFWGCPSCEGRAVSLAILRKACPRDWVDRIWSLVRTSAGVTPRKCPMCLHPMREIPLRVSEGMLALDVCRICQLVWFDPLEFDMAPVASDKLPATVGKDPEQVMREAIAMYQVERMAAAARDESPDQDWKILPGLFGLPVESDSVTLARRPIMTWCLAALITLVSLFAFPDLKDAVRQFGLIPAEPWRLGGATILTSFFLHGGILHLIFNVYFLVVFGDNVEAYLGHGRFLLVLLLATIGGGVLHVVASPDSAIPCIGASGGISGIIVFYALQFPHARLGFTFWLWYYPLRWIQLPAWGALVLWVMLQTVGAFQQVAGFTNVSALAHLGGATVGFLCWWQMRGR